LTPQAERIHGEALQLYRGSQIVSLIGKEAGVVVHIDARSGKREFASAHAFRRAFGDRWALRVMPTVLMQLMRNESIDTTMRYYVGRGVDATADVIW
jgi:integrase